MRIKHNPLRLLIGLASGVISSFPPQLALLRAACAAPLEDCCSLQSLVVLFSPLGPRSPLLFPLVPSPFLPPLVPCCSLQSLLPPLFTFDPLQSLSSVQSLVVPFSPFSPLQSLLAPFSPLLSPLVPFAPLKDAQRPTVFIKGPQRKNQLKKLLKTGICV